VSDEGCERTGHIIVAGCGRVGSQVVLELRRLGASVLVLDVEEERFRAVAEEIGPHLTPIVGDVFDGDELLAAANLKTACGLVTALASTRDNLFLALTAKQRRPDLRVVSRVASDADWPKFRAVGVDAVVSSTMMGGTRLAHMMLNPELAVFADALVASGDRTVVLMTLDIDPASSVAGQRLGAADLQRRTGCVVLGVRRRGKGHYVYHPPPSLRLRAGGSVVALGEPRELLRMEAILGRPPRVSRPATDGEAGAPAAGRGPAV
jgi:Trk K+ transport system NAD-binding subunit